jgi:hypothetical protein
MTHALDAMAVAADHHAVLLENEQVRVLDTRLGPGERTAVHTHEWPAALYVLAGATSSEWTARGKCSSIPARGKRLGRARRSGYPLWERTASRMSAGACCTSSPSS